MAVQEARAPFSLLALAILLLMLFSGLALLSAASWLPGSTLLATLADRLGSATGVALRLAALTGLAGGGLMVARASGLRPARLLVAGWASYAVISVLATTLQPESPIRYALAATEAALLIVSVIAAGRHSWRTPVGLVWGAGIGLAAVASVATLLPAGDPLSALFVDRVAGGLRDWLAFPLAAQALAYWLAGRFSTVGADWADESLLTTAGLMALAGMLATLSRLPPLVVTSWVIHAANGATLLMPLLALIVVAHAYRTLANRSRASTLAAHWTALAWLLFLLGFGVLMPLTGMPVIREWAAGTLLDQSAALFASLFPLSVIPGMVNQVAAELHGKDGRITGLMPFWLVAFGWLIAGSSLAVAGVIQIYVGRVLGVPAGDVLVLLEPVFVLCAFGWLSGATGVLVYGLAFWYRRPPVSQTP
ncbi:MAG: hypothetical protein DIU68_005240 [Chloroflexota bacterium]|nr:MAG: hypothetical protein DIU68_01060 [Chloroflexota bacterium]